MDEFTKEAEKHIDILRGLRASSGLFLAAAQMGVSTGYDKAWLRDNFYATLAFEKAELWDEVRLTWRAVLDLFLKHKDKINWAVQNRPHESFQYIHARYHPETFEEFWEEWGNKQNDAVGAVLYKFALLEEKGHSVIETDEDRAMIQILVDYLRSLEYWHDPDNGVWEEYEEIHLSSIVAVVAGLQKVKDTALAEVSDELIQKGREALRESLPRESVTKFTDLALLSAIYPYEVLTAEEENEILKNIEYHLVKKSGVIRYKNDHYYNKNVDGFSEEAEWTMGFPWLSIIYTRRHDQERSAYYLEKAREVITAPGFLPELYYSNSDRSNENDPLGWAESLYVVALLEYQEVFEKNSPSIL